MSWFKNAIASLYDIVSAPVAATRDGFLGVWEADNAMVKAAREGHIEIVKQSVRSGEQ